MMAQETRYDTRYDLPYTRLSSLLLYPYTRLSSLLLYSAELSLIMLLYSYTRLSSLNIILG